MEFHFPAFFRNEVTSTMELAKEILTNHSVQGPFVAVSRSQTSGRGRLGRNWKTSLGSKSTIQIQEQPESWSTLKEAHLRAGNLLPLTLAIPRESLKIPLSWVSIAAGCALYDAADELAIFLCSAFPHLGFMPIDSPRRLFLKWPNDLISCDLAHDQKGGILGANGKVSKLAGILAETSTQSGEWAWLLLGFGINLTAAPKLDAEPDPIRAGALVSSQIPRSLIEILASQGAVDSPKWLERWLSVEENLTLVCNRFLDSFEREVSEYLMHPRTIGQLRSLALARMVPIGTPLELIDSAVSLSSSGAKSEFAGLGDDGCLILSGRPPIYAGDVSLRVAAFEREVPEEKLKHRKSFSPNIARSSEKDRLRLPVSNAFIGANQTSQVRVENMEDKTPGVLLLDIGNTRAHWGFADSLQGELIYGHSLMFPSSESDGQQATMDSLRDLLVHLSPVKRKRLIIAMFSVREPQLSRAYLDRVERDILRAYPEIRVLRTVVDLTWLVNKEPEFAEIVSSYGNSLGIDRALRMAFLFSQSKQGKRCHASLSLGTATTLEVLGVDESDGVPRLLESMIMPGLQASFNTLHMTTRALPQEDLLKVEQADFDSSSPMTTRVSMTRGVILGVALACAAACRNAGVDKLWICGGSAAHFMALVGHAPFEGFEVELDENLSLRALHILMQRSAGTERVDSVANTGSVDSKESAIYRDDLGQVSLGIAQSLFKGRRHYRSLAASGELRAPPDLGSIESFGSIEMDPDSRDYRRLGPRIETFYVGERLDRHLSLRFRFHSREEWQERISRGDVLLEQRAPRARALGVVTKLWKVKHTYRIKPFDQLWLFQPSEYEPGFVGTVSILKDLGDAAAFHKPGNLVVHATGLYGKNTFLDVLAGMGMKDVYPVHRIDRETSGILLCARKPETRRQLAELFRDGLLDKMYLAFGRSYASVPDSFWVDAAIGPAENSAIRLKMWIDEKPSAAHARTFFRRLAQVGDACLYACFPETGRTNQIRVHLASAGQWILGDKMYHPDERVFVDYFEHGLTPKLLKIIEAPRQALHNAALGTVSNSEDIFRDGPLLCPVSQDLMELRLVRDLLEESGLGLSENEQIKGILNLLNGATEFKSAIEHPVLTNAELLRNAEIARQSVLEKVNELLG